VLKGERDGKNKALMCVWCCNP